jgi:hypothetical protein
VTRNGKTVTCHGHERDGACGLASMTGLLDAVSGGQVYHGRWMSRLGIPPVPAWTVKWFFDLKDKWSGRRK